MSDNVYYSKIAEILKKHSGINIEEDKYYLFDSKLEAIMADYEVENIEQFSEKLMLGDNPKMVSDLIEAMTIHESLFFRDIKVFDQLKFEIFPKIIAERGEDNIIKIWSAACSSGQEVYSIMIHILENELLKGYKYEIIASDISEKIINKAKSGEYTQFEVQRGMPINYLMKYFENIGDIWKVNENIKAPIVFKQHNLLSDPSTIGNNFDIVFIRNVLMYFDKQAKAIILNNIHKSMKKGGFMCMGAPENIIGYESLFEPVPNTVCWFRAI